MDPLADMYPAMSPYGYTLNNPINLIDPDGRQVVAVGDDDYKRKILNTLINLALSSDRGAEQVNTIFAEKKSYVFAQMPGISNQVDKFGATDDYIVAAFGFEEAGSLVSPDEYGGDDREEVSSAVAISHEIHHMLNPNATNGLIGRDGRQADFRSDEVSAVESENIVRRDFGVADRRKYGGVDVYGQGLVPSKYEGYDQMNSKQGYGNHSGSHRLNTPLNNSTSSSFQYRFRGMPLYKYLPAGVTSSFIVSKK